MILRGRPGLLQVVFTLRGSVLQRIYPQILLVSAVSAVIVWSHRETPALVPAFNGAPLALFGVALSVFLGFRNSACYDRWWEARKQWGDLVGTARGLARMTLILRHRGADDERGEILRLVIAFAHGLVDYLRQTPPSPQTRAAPSLAETGEKIPHRALQRLGEILAQLLADGKLNSIEFAHLDGSLERMNAVLAACERLRNTPVPFGYTLLLLRTAYFFCFSVPFGLADILGWLTPLAAAAFAYTFFGLDVLGDELEEPFGTFPNDLPIRALATQVEISLREALGETPPAPPAPVRDVLL